jgi:DNA-binding transcriptional ArsR family regulator
MEQYLESIEPLYDRIRTLSQMVEKLSKDAQNVVNHANNLIIDLVANPQPRNTALKREHEMNREVVLLPAFPGIDSYENGIEKLLFDAGGTAFQSDIVNATGLSKSAISIVLSRMREDGKIVKIRRGRENLIRLNGSP